MQDAWRSHSSRLREKLERLKEPTRDWTEDELIQYLRDYRRLKPTTIRLRLSQLRFMASYEAMPVQLHGGRVMMVSTFWAYVKHREDVDGAGPGGVINDHKAIRSLGEMLGIPNDIWPTRPTLLQQDDRFIPSPEDVYALLHADYTPRANVSYENALIKALLLLDFGVGVRFPSEAHAMKIGDFRRDQHLLTVTEPKKSGKRRRLLLEPEWMCCSSRHPSLGNYLVWRAKVDPNSEQEAFFLKPDGQPFRSKYGLANFLNEHVKPRFPWFHPYLGRHWCANARLIEWGFDYARVADWLGHDKVDMTRREYEHGARILQRLHGDDWLNRIARKPQSNGGA